MTTYAEHYMQLLQEKLQQLKQDNAGIIKIQEALGLLKLKNSLGQDDKTKIIAALNYGEKSTTAYDMNNLNKTIPTGSLGAASSIKMTPIPASSSSSKTNSESKLIVAENEDEVEDEDEANDVFVDAVEDPQSNKSPTPAKTDQVPPPVKTAPSQKSQNAPEEKPYIQTHQYGALLKKEERAKFRYELQKIPAEERLIALQAQNTDSIKRLQESYRNLISVRGTTAKPDRKEKWESTLEILDYDLQYRESTELYLTTAQSSAGKHSSPQVSSSAPQQQQPVTYKSSDDKKDWEAVMKAYDNDPNNRFEKYKNERKKGENKDKLIFDDRHQASVFFNEQAKVTEQSTSYRRRFFSKEIDQNNNPTGHYFLSTGANFYEGSLVEILNNLKAKEPKNTNDSIRVGQLLLKEGPKKQVSRSEVGTPEITDPSTTPGLSSK